MATWAQVSQAEVDALIAASVAPRGDPHPVGTVNPPHIVVGYPDRLDFDETMGRGADRATFEIFLVAGRINEKSAWQVISAAIDGANGVKATLDGTLGGVVDTQRVTDMRVEGVEIAGVTYVAAVFSIDAVF